MNKKEFVAYKGSVFTVEWYFNNNGKSSALEYFESLNDDEQIKLLALFELMGNIGQIRNRTKFNYEGEKIYVFKPQPHRFLCFFFKEGKIIITNAYHKKTNKLPNDERDKAIKCKADYEARNNQGEYYD